MTKYEDRFWHYAERLSEPCMLWRAALDRHGYGKFSADGKAMIAHRVAYELVVGPIPDGLELDHLCRNRECVNPAHLEPVTHAENMRRGRSTRGPLLARAHCKHGHEYVEGSFRRELDGSRRCLICRRAEARARRARRRAEREAGQ